jgi:MFS family permease
VSGGVLATRLYRAGRKNAPFVCTLAALVAMVITSALLPLMPSPYLAAAILVPATFAGAMSSACGAAAAVFATPGDFRAQVTSIYVLTINGGGLLIGPTAVGLLNDHVFTDPTGVRGSLVVVPLVAGGLLTLYTATGLRAYGAAVERLEAAQRSAAAPAA